MKLARLIETQFQRILLFVILSAYAALVGYGIFTINETRNRATNFIVSNVKETVESQVTRQEVAGIDREVSRVYNTWNSTQDLDVRIDVVIDEKLVGHAGNLHSGGFWSIHEVRTFRLPSGQKLVISIEIDILKYVILISSLAAFLGVFLLVSYFGLKRAMHLSVRGYTRPLEDKVEWINRLSANLPNSIGETDQSSESHISEISELNLSLKKLVAEIANLKEKVAVASFREGRLKMAEQLAHNLKGSIATLKIRVFHSALTEDEKTILSASINDISQASKKLLSDSHKKALHETGHTQGPDPERINLKKIISKMVSEQNLVSENSGLATVAFDLGGDPDTSIVAVRSEFESAIRNVINNAVEASSSGQVVNINFKEMDSIATITISDSGKGISSENLPRLMKYRSTFEKVDGTGLGLFHAKQFVDQLGGDISIESQISKGTTVTISLPLVTSSNRIEVELRAGQTIVILDDDPRIHQNWNLLLSDIKDHVQILSFFNPSEFLSWTNENGLGSLGERFYLFDYDLSDAAENGLSLIEKLKIHFETLLVTGMAEDIGIIGRAKKIGVKVVSKEKMNEIRFQVRDPETVNKISRADHAWQ